jgi:hypothetical protein
MAYVMAEGFLAQRSEGERLQLVNDLQTKILEAEQQTISARAAMQDLEAKVRSAAEGLQELPQRP